MTEDHPGACPNAPSGIFHFAAIPVTAHIDQNIVGLRLTVETSCPPLERSAACRPVSRAIAALELMMMLTRPFEAARHDNF